MKNTKRTLLTFAAISLCATLNATANSNFVAIDNIIKGTDANSADNPFLQPEDPALSGGGRDQTLQFGDILFGKSNKDDLIIGNLGPDFIFGKSGNDVLIGGIEHFNPSNRDRAFGGEGDDIFIWKPGDGSDLFRGGPGTDIVVFGITAEQVGNVRKFEVLNDQKSAKVSLNGKTKLPKVDVTNSPGFCEVVDKNSEPDAKKQLNALNLDHLVKFFIRSVADDFDRKVQTTDNGLRVTLHLNQVEFLVCTERLGGAIEIVDLRQSPPARVTLRDVPSRLMRHRIRLITK